MKTEPFLFRYDYRLFNETNNKLYGRRLNMRITQLEVTKDTLWDVLSREDSYLVRFTNSRAKRKDGTPKVSSYPSGVSFRHVPDLTVREVLDLVNSGKAAIVSVQMEEES